MSYTNAAYTVAPDAEVSSETDKEAAILAQQRCLEQSLKQAEATLHSSTEMLSRAMEVVQLPSLLRELLKCEICGHFMREPYINACGHTCCLTCHEKWFTAIRTQHLDNHCDINLEQSNILISRLVHRLRSMRSGADANNEMEPVMDSAVDIWEHSLAQALVKQNYWPTYTCPFCRNPTTTPPVINFYLKALVDSLSDLLNESFPNEATEDRDAGSTIRWDLFFPLAPSLI